MASLDNMSVKMEETVEEPPLERTITIVGQGGVQTDLDLNTIGDDEIAAVLPDMLADYAADIRDWTTLTSEHWRQGRLDRAEELMKRGLQYFGGGPGRQPNYPALVRLHVIMAHFNLALARTAPKELVPFAKYDKLKPDVKKKDFYYNQATESLNRAEAARQAGGGVADEPPISMTMGKITHYLARGQPAMAQDSVEKLLLRHPNNVLALTIQARLQFARRSHQAALQTYQTLLRINPNMLPDPRIGIGLCAWVLGDHARARQAWQIALKRDPRSWVALLLLGLAALNDARDVSATEKQRIDSQQLGTEYVSKAFRMRQTSSAAALAMATVTAQRGEIQRASKLAEHAVQFSDNRQHTAQANTERGRLGFVAGDNADAAPFLSAARSDGTGFNMMAEMTLGQIAIKNGSLREALNFFEGNTKKITGRPPLEYTILHASLLAYPHPGMREDELARNKATARDMLTELHAHVNSAVSEEDRARLRGAEDDADIFLDLAKLWQNENLEIAIGAYQTAVSGVSDEDEGAVDLRTVKMESNLGVLFQLQGNVETAERMYQEALTKVANEESKESEALRTVLAYNLGRACEEKGDREQATKWYRDVLRQHPEHMESKIRMAMMAAAAGRNLDAHTYLKECLKADETSTTLRTVYTDFLISMGSLKEALAFTSQTLKYDKPDPATFCALGWIHFALGREAKSSTELAARPKEYLRSAEAYNRALEMDPKCATAAQGLAIALAEDTLALKTGSSLAVGDEIKQRHRLAGQALGIFSRLNDSIVDGSVSINMGHCFFARQEEEKAIQAYEAALNALKSKGTYTVSILLYLSRAWYAYASRDSNFSAMSRALAYSQQAMHLQPSDRAILYNIAMILQKGAEILLGLDPSKRTLEELQIAVTQAEQAASMFQSLADDRSGALPYDADMATQRARYGDSLLRRAPEQMARQEAYEGEFQARVKEARRARADEQARIQAAEATRRAEIEAKAAELAELRRRAQEEALAWQEELNTRQAEEETRRVAAVEKRKQRKENGDIDSADEGEGKERKRKRKGGKKSRKIRSKSEISEDEELPLLEASASATPDLGEEEDEETTRQRKARDTLAKLKSRRKPKRQFDDPDEEEDQAGKRGKQFKSKAFIEDSDEEAEEAGDGDDGDVDGDEDEAVAEPANAAEANGHEMEVDDLEPAAVATTAANGEGGEDEE